MEEKNLIKYTIIKEKENVTEENTTNIINDNCKKDNKIKLLILYLCKIVNCISFIVHNILMLFILSVVLYYRNEILGFFQRSV